MNADRFNHDKVSAFDNQIKNLLTIGPEVEVLNSNLRLRVERKFDECYQSYLTENSFFQSNKCQAINNIIKSNCPYY